MAVLCASAFAASDPTYTAVRTARPDGRTIAVENFSFDRDVFHFTLNGTLHLLAPVEGKNFGVVFTGQGSYTLTPATAIELRSVALNAGDDKLTQLADTFTRAVFFDAELAKKTITPSAGASIGDANSAYDAYMKKQKKDFSSNFHIRVLQEILDAPAEPMFVAYVDGKKYPPAMLQVDPLDREPVSWVSADRDKGGIWYSAYLKDAYSKGTASVQPRTVKADRYTIDSTIASNTELSGTTTMSFVANRDARVLPLELMYKLRVQDASLSPASDAPVWTPVAWIQEDKDEDGNLAVVMPEPLKKGQKYLLKITYKGKDVLDNAGDGNFTIGARTSWYPNAGVFDDPAMFDITYRFPDGKNQIISVGNETSNKVESGLRVSTWKTAHPIRVAGFNYGRFKKMSQTDKDSGVTVDVYTNVGEPDIIRDINRALSYASARSSSEDMDAYIGPSSIRVDTGSLAQSAFADGVNTARTGKVFFGPLDHDHVAITQQSQWFFGQSWPGLVYLPYLAFVDSTTRNTLGLNFATDFVDVVGPHELAHQWWGHQVGWKTYHDQWLSEGFAEFTAGLVVQQTKGNAGYNKFWEKKRKTILEKSFKSTITNDKAGPISQGWRLSTWQDPSGANVIMYEKGAYVLHMLRMAMQDPRKQNRDQDFIEMMTDFATTYTGKNPSTSDFQRIVEKHLTPSLKLTTDGKLDWFFQQWVHGTAIPKFTSKVEITDAGGGKYKLSGTVTQSEVPNDFVSVLPLYVTFDKGQVIRIGSIPMIGNVTKDVNVELPLPGRPKALLVNAMHDVLAR
jgi:hypothetical protein